MNSSKVKTVSVCFNQKMFDKINSYCAARGCSRSWFMSKAAELYLKECLEDKEDYEIAVKAWKDFEKDGLKISSKELFEKAGL